VGLPPLFKDDPQNQGLITESSDRVSTVAVKQPDADDTEARKTALALCPTRRSACVSPGKIPPQ